MSKIASKKKYKKQRQLATALAKAKAAEKNVNAANCKIKNNTTTDLNAKTDKLDAISKLPKELGGYGNTPKYEYNYTSTPAENSKSILNSLKNGIKKHKLISALAALGTLSGSAYGVHKLYNSTNNS